MHLQSRARRPSTLLKSFSASKKHFCDCRRVRARGHDDRDRAVRHCTKSQHPKKKKKKGSGFQRTLNGGQRALYDRDHDRGLRRGHDRACACVFSVSSFCAPQACDRDLAPPQHVRVRVLLRDRVRDRVHDDARVHKTEPLQID